MIDEPLIPPPDEPDPGLGQVIRRLRERQALSQAELAARAEVDPATLAQVEEGMIDPPWTTVRALAASLGVSVESIAEAVAGRRGDAENH